MYQEFPRKCIICGKPEIANETVKENIMEKNTGAVFSSKPGEKAKDPEKGWFIVNENGAQIFLEDDRKEYIKTYKQYNDAKVLTSFSDIAQKLIFNTTDEKNG